MPASPRILVVDDDVEMRAYVRSCLGPLAGEVIEADDGIQALEILRSGDGPPVALVITDLRMARSGGLVLRDAMLDDEALQGVPVLLVTGETDTERAGGTPVLLKPFSGRLLRTCVTELCGE